MLLSLMTLDDVEKKFHFEVNSGCCNGGPSNVIHHNIIVYVDHAA